jgi:hypothetical protein
MSGEIQNDVAEAHRVARKEVQSKINNRIASKEYGKGLIEWHFIPIILSVNDPKYHEVKKNWKNKQIAEFRLKIDHLRFKSSDPLAQKKLLFQSLIRSLRLFPEIGVEDFDHENLYADVIKVGEEQGWL